MRLINTSSLELKEFFDENIPKYAILSHRWEQEEISFKDYVKGRNTDSAGYRKVRKFCSIASQGGYEWAWVDTCCIDKTSSAELSEAINSMFRWYRDADICYAYLSDTEFEAGQIHGFAESKWFTRGWTLQELMAPEHVWFLDRYWQSFGTKRELARDISHITGISFSDIFEMNGEMLHCIPVACKMSWASKRHTSRIEDIAYCLLGLFNINMPLLYGEGTKAFYRLQQEIVKESNDMNIFAWGDKTARNNSLSFRQVNYNSMFAPLPAYFSINEMDAFGALGSMKISRSDFSKLNSAGLEKGLIQPFGMTNRGLRLDACILDLDSEELGISDRTPMLRRCRFVLLNCTRKTSILCTPVTGAEHIGEFKLTSFRYTTSTYSVTAYMRAYADNSVFIEIDKVIKHIKKIKFETIFLV